MAVVSSLGRDLRFAIRQMRQTPIVSGVALLSLALGIGANVAIFSLVNALMLKQLPVHAPEQLVIFGYQGTRGPNTSVTNPQWEYLRDHQDVLVGTGAFGNPRFNLNSRGEVRPANGLFVSGRFFDTLGVQAHIGRLFTADDDVRGGGKQGPVAVLSYGFWQREYGGRADVIGQTIVLDGHPLTCARDRGHDGDGYSRRTMGTSKAGRNDACPCGSGKKYKKCCELKEGSLRNRSNTAMLVIVGVLMAAGVVAGITAFTADRNHVSRPGGTWSPEHGHYH